MFWHIIWFILIVFGYGILLELSVFTAIFSKMFFLPFVLLLGLSWFPISFLPFVLNYWQIFWILQIFSLIRMKRSDEANERTAERLLKKKREKDFSEILHG